MLEDNLKLQQRSWTPLTHGADTTLTLILHRQDTGYALDKSNFPSPTQGTISQ